MRARRVEQAALSTFLVAACVMFFIAAYTAIAHAQNPSSSVTIPQQPEVSVSPTTPGTLPGTQAGGSSALNGGLAGATTTSDQQGEPGQATTGLPPNNSIYGLGTATNPWSLLSRPAFDHTRALLVAVAASVSPFDVKSQPIAATSVASLPDIGWVTPAKASPNGSVAILLASQSA